jgi:hypothetical protein
VAVCVAGTAGLRHSVEEDTMAKSKKPKQPVARAAEKRNGASEDFVPHAHLIRLPDTEARKRALMLLGEVQRPYIMLPDFQWLITNDHLAVLRKEGIPFEALS